MGHDPMPAPVALLSAFSLVFAAGGCATVGPTSIRSDRFNYNQAGAQSANEQILLNIVRLRYGEPTYFLEVSSMLSHYALGVGGHASRYKSDLNVWNNPALRAIYDMRGEPVTGSQTWDANLNYTDSPTISYVPLTGEEFTNRVMAPVPPMTILYLSQSGWSIDRLLECCVQELNGIKNAPTHDVSDADTWDTGKFRTVARLFKKAQDAGLLSFEAAQDLATGATFIRPGNVPKELAEDVSELKALLGLPEASDEPIKIYPGVIRAGQNELAMQTRSVLGVLNALAQTIPPPTEHERGGHVRSLANGSADLTTQRWLHVEYGRLPAPDAFVQVFYNGYWWYIRNTNWSSKRTFALISYLFSLQATDQAGLLPVVTVPAGR